MGLSQELFERLIMNGKILDAFNDSASYGNLTATRGELDCIWHQVQQDLLESLLVEHDHQIVIFGKVLDDGSAIFLEAIHVQDQTDADLLCFELQNHHDLLDAVFDVEPAVELSEPSRADLSVIQNIVDQKAEDFLAAHKDLNRPVILRWYAFKLPLRDLHGLGLQTLNDVS